MEDTLRVEEEVGIIKDPVVLILVLMEDTLRVLQSIIFFHVLKS